MNKNQVLMAAALLEVRQQALTAKTESAYLDGVNYDQMPKTTTGTFKVPNGGGEVFIDLDRDLYEAALEAIRETAAKKLAALGVTEIGL